LTIAISSNGWQVRAVMRRMHGEFLAMAYPPETNRFLELNPVDWLMLFAGVVLTAIVAALFLIR
jgi:hypothetical protein